MEMAKQGIQATSKTSLKLQCLFCSGGNLKEAKELYEFLAGEMPDLPDQDPIPPTWMDNTKNTVNGLFGWLKENQDTLAQTFDFFRSIVQRNPVLPSAEAEAPLPDINE